MNIIFSKGIANATLGIVNLHALKIPKDARSSLQEALFPVRTCLLAFYTSVRVMVEKEDMKGKSAGSTFFLNPYLERFPDFPNCFFIHRTSISRTHAHM